MLARAAVQADDASLRSAGRGAAQLSFRLPRPFVNISRGQPSCTHHRDSPVLLLISTYDIHYGITRTFSKPFPRASCARRGPALFFNCTCSTARATGSVNFFPVSTVYSSSNSAFIVFVSTICEFNEWRRASITETGSTTKPGA
jgi:hypothetical protein